MDKTTLEEIIQNPIIYGLIPSGKQKIKLKLASKQHTKEKPSYKIVFLIICLLLSVGLKAQTVTINVETAGTLSSLIPAARKLLITKLKLTGNLNGSDFLFVREMAGSDVNGNSTTGKLAVLDLSDANIVSGGSVYFSDYSAETNKIGARMFSGCTSLISITIPNSVTFIGSAAFYRCNSLVSVTIPNSVTSIGSYAFSGCTSLVSITIPNNVTSIDSETFSGCTSLVSITIPNSVTSIGKNAFSGCESLISITIPNSVTSIGSSAFNRCTSLTSVTIPNRATSIGSYAFSGCTGLKEFIVSNENVKYSAIDGVLFNKNATTLILYPEAKGSTYSIPNSVTSIGNQAFYGCSSLTSVAIPNSVTSIGNQAFYGCSSLTSVAIPNSVISIGSSAFYMCSSLASVAIPNSVISIGNQAFYGCRLTSVTIGNSVTSIGSETFYGCTKLAEIHCKKATPITLASDATCFSGVNRSTCKLYVPKGSYSSYWYASFWGDFINVIEEDDTDGINTITSDDLSISSSSEGININSDKAIEVSIYNVSGQCVYKGTVSGEVTIPVENGLYIAKVGDKTFKVQK